MSLTRMRQAGLAAQQEMTATFHLATVPWADRGLRKGLCWQEENCARVWVKPERRRG